MTYKFIVAIASKINRSSKIQDNFNNVEIGSYPFNKEGQFGTSLVMRSADLEALDRCEDEITKMIKKLA